jgi:hypothetical protein
MSLSRDHKIEECAIVKTAVEDQENLRHVVQRISRTVKAHLRE